MIVKTVTLTFSPHLNLLLQKSQIVFSFSRLTFDGGNVELVESHRHHWPQLWDKDKLSKEQWSGSMLACPRLNTWHFQSQTFNIKGLTDIPDSVTNVVWFTPNSLLCVFMCHLSGENRKVEVAVTYTCSVCFSSQAFQSKTNMSFLSFQPSVWSLGKWKQETGETEMFKNNFPCVCVKSYASPVFILALYNWLLGEQGRKSNGRVDI